MTYDNFASVFQKVESQEKVFVLTEQRQAPASIDVQVGVHHPNGWFVYVATLQVGEYE